MKAAGRIRAYFPREDFPPIYIALEKGWDPSIEELWPNFIEWEFDPVAAAEIIVEMKKVTDAEKMWEWMSNHSAFFLKEAKGYLELLTSALPAYTCPRCAEEMETPATHFAVRIKMKEDPVHVCGKCYKESNQIREKFAKELEQALGEWYSKEVN